MPTFENTIEISYQCPYCGETLRALLDPDESNAEGYFEYTEDCSVCCSPIVISGRLDLYGNPTSNPTSNYEETSLYSITTRREND